MSRRGEQQCPPLWRPDVCLPSGLPEEEQHVCQRRCGPVLSHHSPPSLLISVFPRFWLLENVPLSRNDTHWLLGGSGLGSKVSDSPVPFIRILGYLYKGHSCASWFSDKWHKLSSGPTSLFRVFLSSPTPLTQVLQHAPLKPWSSLPSKHNCLNSVRADLSVCCRRAGNGSDFQLSVGRALKVLTFKLRAIKWQEKPHL